MYLYNTSVAKYCMKFLTKLFWVPSYLHIGKYIYRNAFVVYKTLSCCFLKFFNCIWDIKHSVVWRKRRGWRFLWGRSVPNNFKRVAEPANFPRNFSVLASVNFNQNTPVTECNNSTEPPGVPMFMSQRDTCVPQTAVLVS